MEMSTPVTKIWDGVLFAPIVGLVDSKRAVDIMNKADAPPNDFLDLVTRDFGDPWWHDTMGYYDGTETISACEA